MANETFERLQRELAYSAARADIESFCLARSAHPHQTLWFDTSLSDEGCEMEVARAIRYLTAAGLLVRHSERPVLVRVKDLPA